MHCMRGTFHKIIIDPKLNQLFRISEADFVQNTVLQSTKLHWKHCNAWWQRQYIYIQLLQFYANYEKYQAYSFPLLQTKQNDFQKY